MAFEGREGSGRRRLRIADRSAVLFHSQQAVEKSLKAFLSRHRTPFRKTHNLVELGETCCLLDPSLESLLRQPRPEYILLLESVRAHRT